MMDWKTQYEEAEVENDRLRGIVRWCAPRVLAADLPTLRRMFDDAAVPDTTDDLEADLARTRALAMELAALIEPVMTTRKIRPGWDAKVEALLERVRAIEPKHPILRPDHPPPLER